MQPEFMLELSGQRRKSVLVLEVRYHPMLMFRVAVVDPRVVHVDPAVQGWQECDFKLTLPQGAPQLRQQLSCAGKKQVEPPQFDPKQRWRLERDLDRDTRRVCEAS